MGDESLPRRQRGGDPGRAGLYLDKDETGEGGSKGEGVGGRLMRQRTDDSDAGFLVQAPGLALRYTEVHCCCLDGGTGWAEAAILIGSPSVYSPSPVIAGAHWPLLPPVATPGPWRLPFFSVEAATPSAAS